MSDLLVTEDWRDYELIDSGEGVKLERWGQYLTVRPEPRAIWRKTTPVLWKEADAIFMQKEDEGEWQYKEHPPEDWQIGYNGLRFKLRPTNFRHVGIFPEQAINWKWIAKQITDKNEGADNRNIKILNLFAYTGGATMAAASAGAHVTHVDASRPAMMWASENAKLTHIPTDGIRWIQDDALKFVLRENRRGVKYDGIIMDPPRFGRGARGEIWKLADNLPELVSACKQILSSQPIFFLINAYTADLSHLAIKYLLKDVMGSLNGKIESGEVGMVETESKKILPAGIVARWER